MSQKYKKIAQMEYVTIEQFHELKTIALFALSFAVVGVVGMLAGLAVNIRNSNTLKNARESQYHYLSKVDKLLENQQNFFTRIELCENHLLEIKGILHKLKAIGFDLQSSARNYENTNRNQANPKNSIKIETPKEELKKAFYNRMVEERQENNDRLERLEIQLASLLKQFNQKE